MNDERVTTLSLQHDLHFVARTPGGHEVHLSARVDGDDAPDAPTPMEMLLITLAGCGAMDVISILRKMRQDVASYDLRISGERAPEHPRVYTSILMTHELRGGAIVEANVVRAIHLSMSRYCPVFAMLHPAVAIRERYVITDDGGGREEGEVRLDDTAAG